jgi:hypothetical protein
MRRFHLLRDEDETGVSGKGVVAEGCVFTDGVTVIRWHGATPSTVVHDSITAVEKIHGHGGKTKIIWKDE